MLELYAIADGNTGPGEDDPAVVICTDEFGPRNLQPRPGRPWAPAAAGPGDPASPRRRRRRATYNRPHGVRHLLAGYDLSRDRLSGHVVTRKGRTEFLAFARYLRSLHPSQERIAIVLDSYSPHLSTQTDSRVGDWARAHNLDVFITHATVPTLAGAGPEHVGSDCSILPMAIERLISLERSPQPRDVAGGGLCRCHSAAGTHA